MTVLYWRGDAPAVAEVKTLTLSGTWESDDLILLTINGKRLVVPAASTVTGDIASTVADAWNECAIAEFAEVTAEAVGSAVLLTHDTPGVPFGLAVVTTEANDDPADDQAADLATTTAATGPYHWDEPANWSTGAAPANGDEVYLADSSVDVRYGLEQSAVTLDKLDIARSYTGRVGLPQRQRAGYVEYRETYLQIGAAAMVIGAGDGAGSGSLRIDTGTAQTAIDVHGTGPSSEAGIEAFLWRGNHADNQLHVTAGSVGVAVLPGETATLATLRVGYQRSVAGDAAVRCGAGATLDAVEQSGGLLVLQSDVATATVTDGELVYLDGALGALELDGGSVRYRSAGELTLAAVGRGGVLDFRQDMRPRTVAGCALHDGFELHDPFRTVTFSAGIDLVRCSPADGLLNIGSHLTLTPTAI